MLVETVLSMLTVVCHFKRVMHRGWTYFYLRLAFTMAAFNVLVQLAWWVRPNAAGFVPLVASSLVCKILNDYLVCKRLTPSVNKAPIYTKLG